MPTQIQIDELREENIKISKELVKVKTELKISKEKVKLLEIIDKKDFNQTGNEKQNSFDKLNKGCSPNMEDYYQQQAELKLRKKS